MAQEKSEASRLSGEYMIQDRDHTTDAGQMGDDASQRRGRQVEQAQSPTQQQGAGQQGGDQPGGRQQG